MLRITVSHNFKVIPPSTLSVTRVNFLTYVVFLGNVIMILRLLISCFSIISIA